MTNEEHDIHDDSLRYWSGRAQEYSALHRAEYDSPKQQRFAAVLAHFMPQLDRPVDALDVGCGSGFLSLTLASLGCHVTGIDFSPDMLEQARGNAQAKGFGCIAFEQMAAQDISFDDASFDFVVTRNVTWVLQDVDRVYAQIMRVLRPGGVLVNMDANYGRAFNAADARGETPTHPTQTLEQLQARNAIARDLDITAAERPQWDMVQLWDLGAAAVECHRDLDALVVHDGATHQPLADSRRREAPMFVVAARK